MWLWEHWKNDIEAIWEKVGEKVRMVMYFELALHLSPYD